MDNAAAIRIGTAGWSIPAAVGSAFPADGSHLERYSGVFCGVEINSSFHRPHRTSTYQRWAAAVPETFRFAVKIPKAITHVGRLRDVEVLTDRFLAEVAGLENKLGPILVQLPPSLAFDAVTAERFLRDLKARVVGPVACEPRHPSWFASDAEGLMKDLHVGRVTADPAPVPQASQPGGWRGLTYFRLHGSPHVYYTAYSEKEIQAALASLAAHAAEGSECWCIFDNTAAGAATANAMTARQIIAGGVAPS